MRIKGTDARELLDGNVSASQSVRKAPNTFRKVQPH